MRIDAAQPYWKVTGAVVPTIIYIYSDDRSIEAIAGTIPLRVCRWTRWCVCFHVSCERALSHCYGTVERWARKSFPKEACLVLSAANFRLYYFAILRTLQLCWNWIGKLWNCWNAVQGLIWHQICRKQSSQSMRLTKMMARKAKRRPPAVVARILDLYLTVQYYSWGSPSWQTTWFHCVHASAFRII